MVSVKGAGRVLGEKAREKAAGARKKLRSAKERLGDVKDNWRMSGRKAVADYAKEKVSEARADRRYASIYVIEIALIAVIVFSIAVFIDDGAQLNLFSFMPQQAGACTALSGSASAGSPACAFLPPPYSYIVFILVLVVVFLLYRYTEEFRKSE
ncbi:MAG: hypothetical protein V1676_02900 [Candidatus Diapherotrites archaeon]